MLEPAYMDDGKRQMCGCVDLRIWQRVKDGCWCGGHPHFTHPTQPRLWTNERCINMGTAVRVPYFVTGTLL